MVFVPYYFLYVNPSKNELFLPNPGFWVSSGVLMCCAPCQQDVQHLHCGSSTEWLLQVNASYGSTKWLVPPKFSNNPESTPKCLFMRNALWISLVQVVFVPYYFLYVNPSKNELFLPNPGFWVSSGVLMCCAPYQQDVQHLHCGSSTEWLLQVNASYGSTKWLVSPKFHSNQKSKLYKASNKYSVFMHAIILFGSSGVCPLLLPLCKSFKKWTFSAQSWILGFKRCFDVLCPTKWMNTGQIGLE